jgi:hypothetical protein
MRALLCLTAFAGAALTGCSTTVKTAETHSETVVERVYVPPESGVVQYVWEEPMVDVVEVPPGLDPEGHYYRPAHQEVIEIRQGRWQYYKQGEANKASGATN